MWVEPRGVPESVRKMLTEYDYYKKPFPSGKYALTVIYTTLDPNDKKTGFKLCAAPARIYSASMPLDYLIILPEVPTIGKSAIFHSVFYRQPMDFEIVAMLNKGEDIFAFSTMGNYKYTLVYKHKSTRKFLVFFDLDWDKRWDDLVVMLNMISRCTSNSCGGHKKRSSGNPSQGNRQTF